MSIRTVLPSEQNEGAGTNMTVGTSIEISSSVTSPTAESLKSEKCFALPYQDHDYGAPSINNFITFPEKDEYNSFHHDKTIELSATPIPSIPGKINGFTDIDSNSCQSAATDYSDLNEDITRCICGFEHDDGYMICCDRCSVWQHIDCMQIDRNSIPETYLCEKCEPRPFNQEYAIKLQTTKREEFLAHDSESGTEDEKAKEINGVTYTAVQSTPTSMTITSNRHKKVGHHTGGKKRKRSADSHLVNKRGIRDGKKRPQARFRSKSLLSAASEIDSTWMEEMHKWKHTYSTQDTNGYTETLKAAVKNIQDLDNNSNNILLQLTAQLTKVQQLKDTLLAMEDIAAGQPILEYIGSYMLRKSFENGGNDLKKRPYPYVLFYNGLDGLEICVDSRAYGNISRFIKRSCSPNSEIRHVIDSGELHLFVVCKKDISKDSEITIPFDFKYDQCYYPVTCSCTNGKTCPVNISTRQKYLNSNKTGKVGFTSINGLSNGYASSDELGENDEYHQRKKSREERKMESYIRAFKELEKKEKKKELLQQHNHEMKHNNNSTPAPLTLTPTIQSLSEVEVAVTSSQCEKVETITTTVVASTPPTLTTLTSDCVVTTSTAESIVSTSSALPSAVITTPVPVKCNARRRSNRVRRVSRKLQTAINDENICNKLLSNDPMNALPPSGIFLQPSPLSETMAYSTTVVNTAVATNPQISVAGDVNLSTSETNVPELTNTIQTDDLLKYPEGSKTTDSEIKQSDNLNEMNATSKLIDNKNINSSEEAASFIEPCNNVQTSSSWQTHDSTVVSSIESNKLSIKLVKSSSKLKRPSSTVEWISGRSMSPILTGRPRSVSICNPSTSESSLSTPTVKEPLQIISKPITTEPQYPVLNCNVVPWDFKPGIPNGMVRIHVSGHSRSRSSFVKLNLKKRWLNQVQEDKQTKKCVDCSKTDCKGDCISKSTQLKFLPLKKRKLLEVEPSVTNNESQPQTISNSIKIDEKIEVLSSEDIQNALGTTPHELSAQSDSLPNLHKLDIPDLLMDAEQPSPDLPVLDEIGLSQQEATSLPLQECDMLNEILPISLLNPDNFEQQQPAAAVKRKVSLQEYLKRSKPKESKKDGGGKPTLSIVSIAEDIAEKEPISETIKETEPVENSEKSQESTLGKIKVNTSEPTQTKVTKDKPKELSVEKKAPVKVVAETTQAHNQLLDKITQAIKSVPKPLSAEVHKLSSLQTCLTENITPSQIESNNITEKLNLQTLKKIIGKSSTDDMKLQPRKSFVDSSPLSSGSTPKEHVIVLKSTQENHMDITPIHSPLPQSSYTRSRHNSSASSNSSKSPVITQDHYPEKTHIKSPKGMPISRTFGRRNNTGKPWHEPNNFRRKSPPRKVPSLTPAVPGQPIPSLMRTGDGRGPQRIYNHESPRRDIRSPSPERWRHQHPTNSSYSDRKYAKSPNAQWRRSEYEYRRESYSPGPPGGYQPRPYYRQNSTDHQNKDNRPYSPKQYYRHEENSNYHVPYNDQPPSFRKQHSTRYSPNNAHYDYSYHYS